MTNSKNFILRVLFAGSALTAGSAFALDIALPPETISYRPASCPGIQWCCVIASPVIPRIMSRPSHRLRRAHTGTRRCAK